VDLIDPNQGVWDKDPCPIAAAITSAEYGDASTPEEQRNCCVP